MLPSAFEDKPLCVPRQLAELLQLSVEVCGLRRHLRHDWKRLGIFCVWRNAPMRVLSLQGDLVDSYDPALKKHRTVCSWPSTGTATCTEPCGRHGLQLCGYMSKADNVYDPFYGSFVGDREPGALPRCTSQCLQTGWQSCTLGRTSRRQACPTRRLERWTSTASRFWTQPWRPATRCGLGAAAEARAPCLGQLYGGRLPAGAYAITPERLRLEHRAHLHGRRCSFGCAGWAWPPTW